MHFLRSIASRQSSVVILLNCLFLSAIHLSLFTSPSLAYSPPNPQPCQNAKETEHLTDNYITDENGNPPIYFDFSATGNNGQAVGQTFQATFQVDFSKLESIFAAPNSNYLEGKFQDSSHQSSNLLGLIGTKPEEFNEFNGAEQKTIPKQLVDTYKIKYIDYILNNPNLPESVNKYTDIDGQNPKTIYELYQDFTQSGVPYPPQVPISGENRDQWMAGWGKYWQKIPTAYQEFYNGYLDFRVATGNRQLRWALGQIYAEDRTKYNITGPICLDPVRDPIRFVMPEFNRTESVSDKLNQAIVPCAAQSFRHAPASNPQLDDCKTNPQVASQPNNQNLLAKVVSLCQKILSTPQKVVNKFKNAIKVSLRLFNPVALAADASPAPCFVKLAQLGKEGSAPFCALPATSLSPGDHCINNPSAKNKLDIGNNNVICTFTVTYTANLTIDPDGALWDTCVPSGSQFTCSTKIRIFPNFRIPFLTEIWNNTLYSDQTEGGVQSSQQTGRPGIYSTFTPKSIYYTLFPTPYDRALDMLTKCYPQWPDQTEGDPAACEALNAIGNIIPCAPNPDITRVADCVKGKLPKHLPGKVTSVLGTKSSQVLAATSGDQKERFIGGTDCSKTFVRDMALKPKALQQEAGITKQDCNLQAKTVSSGGSPSPRGGVPLPTGCPASFDTATPHQTTLEELECYIAQVAAGDTEPISGQNLALVMINIMAGEPHESGGDQCAAGTSGEIGIFQYTAETWKGSPGNLGAIDSGSINGICWGVPGNDPVPNNTVYLGFNWPIQFGGTNDGGAWNPFSQIETTRALMLNAEACKWTTYKAQYGAGICP